MDQQCEIQHPKQRLVTVQITCRTGESLESACWRWRPVMGDRLVIVIRRRRYRAAVVRRLVESQG